MARGLAAVGRALRDRATGSSLVRNSGFIMATTVVNSGIGFVFWAVAARAYEPSMVGLAAAIISAMVLTSLVCGVGTDAIVIAVLPKRCSGREWSLTLHAALAAGVGASLAGALLVVFALPRLSEQYSEVSGAAAIVFVLGAASWTASTVLDAVFVAERAARLMLLRNFVLAIGKLALLLVSLLAAASWLSIFVPWVAASVASILAAALLLPRLRRDYTPTFDGLATEIHRLSSRLAGHHFIGLSAALPPLALPVLVAARLSPTDNAYFYATWMVGGIFFVISPAVAAALFAEGSHDRRDLQARIGTSAKFIACLLVPLTLAYLVAGRLVLGLFGDAYVDEGWPVLLLLLASAFPDAITNIYTAVMRIDNRLVVAGLLNAGIAATTIIVSWLLLPRLGITAAALAWLIAQTAGTLLVACHVVIARLRTHRPPDVVTGADV